MKSVAKAFAYESRGDRLLVFEHADFPEAGLQVPAGTIEPGESAEAAVRREVTEETGLSQFASVLFLGIAEFDARPYGKDELHLRHFYFERELPAALKMTGDAIRLWRSAGVDTRKRRSS